MALALAGYWTASMPSQGAFAEPGRPLVIPAGHTFVAHGPVMIVAGELGVVEERVGQRPKRLLRLGAGALLVPIGSFQTRPGIRLEAVADVEAQELTEDDLLRALADLSAGPDLARALSTALRQQHWLLRLSAEAEPMARLKALLLRIAEDVGVPDAEGIFLRGAPDVRELAVLAGISRENAVIDLEWLVHTGVLDRRDGRLWVRDIEALKPEADS